MWADTRPDSRAARQSPLLPARFALLFAGLGAALPAATAAAHEDAGTSSVDLLFATTRAQTLSSDPADRYGGGRGFLRYGVCTVETSPIPFVESIAERVDFYVPTLNREIVGVADLDEQVLEKELRAGGDERPIVLFVHGYSYGFARGCRRVSDLQQLLDGRATVLLFSWPSDGNPADYVADQADLEWSVPALTRTIGKLADEFGASRIRLVAHSLGTRGVMQALTRLRLERRERPVSSQLVLIAPDYDREVFLERFPTVESLVGHVTIYASSKDTPLKVSAGLHGSPRLGQAGEHLTLIEGVDTIDVSTAGRYQLNGHEYHYFHPAVARDLVPLLAEGAKASQRPTTQARGRRGEIYWAIRDAAKTPDEGT